MGDKFLLIHTNKENGAYDRYEAYSLTESLTREKLFEAIESHNNNETKTTTVKVYEDDLLYELVSDSLSSFKFKNLIESLQRICDEIEDQADNLESWSDDIRNFIRKQMVQEKDMVNEK